MTQSNSNFPNNSNLDVGLGSDYAFEIIYVIVFTCIAYS